MNEEMKFCQSCGMPMQAAGDFGTETDGSPSGEYCVYCYKGGTFTAACTMEEMIRHCAQFHEQFRDENGKSYTFEESVTLMREYFPTLKRWKKDRASQHGNNIRNRENRMGFTSIAVPG